MDEHKYRFNWKAQARICNRAIALGYEPQDFPWLLKTLQEQVNQRLDWAPGASMHVELPSRRGATDEGNDFNNRAVALTRDCFEED